MTTPSYVASSLFVGISRPNLVCEYGNISLHHVRHQFPYWGIEQKLTLSNELNVVRAPRVLRSREQLLDHVRIVSCLVTSATQ